MTLDCQSCGRPFESEGSAFCGPCRGAEARGVDAAPRPYTGEGKPLGDRRMGERPPRAKVAQIVPCIRCGRMYERERSSGHFCAACATVDNRVKTSERMAKMREEAERVVQLLVPDVDIATLDHYVNSYDLTPDDDWALVEDQMPDGASSPYGPDEGRSSFFEDLRLELDLLSLAASKDSWWRENPHWNFELHERENLREHLEELERNREGTACEERVGTTAGYKVHLREGDKPCTPCTKAQAEYLGRWRRRNHR